jgi:hypothetical protein
MWCSPPSLCKRAKGLSDGPATYLEAHILPDVDHTSTLLYMCRRSTCSVSTGSATVRTSSSAMSRVLAARRGRKLTASGSVGGDALPPVHRLSGFG